MLHHLACPAKGTPKSGASHGTRTFVPTAPSPTRFGFHDLLDHLVGAGVGLLRIAYRAGVSFFVVAALIAFDEIAYTLGASEKMSQFTHPSRRGLAC
jgi:hypothetical protein